MAYVFPAIRAKQGDRDYYLSSMTYGEVAKLVDLPDERVFDSLLTGTSDMQRKLNWSRVRGEMKDYLVRNKDAFYSALTLFIVPLDLTIDLQEGKDFVFKPDGADPARGTLEVFGTAVFFPGDGMHRAASMREAIKHNHALAPRHVPVVLMLYRGKDDVRQLFSDLNLHAKPVNKTIGRAFETRDPVVVLTKRVAEDVELFRGRVNMMTNSLSASSPHVITLNALYEGTRSILAAQLGCGIKELAEKLKHLSALPPTDAEVGKHAAGVVEVWDVIIGALPEWQTVIDGKAKPGDLRDKYVFAHGLGWQAIAQAAGAIIRADGEGWDQTLTDALKKINWARMAPEKDAATGQVRKDPTTGDAVLIANPVWQGIAMVETRVNNTGPGIQATAKYIVGQAGIATETTA
jgi:DNA sulfur modification protein DndB